MDYKKYELAINIIGCNIDTYGHFDAYSIPGEDGKGLFSADFKDNPEVLLQLVEKYYTDKKSLNKDYGDDLKYQNSCKKFIKDRIVAEKHYPMGMQWIEENL